MNLSDLLILINPLWLNKPFSTRTHWQNHVKLTVKRLRPGFTLPVNLDEKMMQEECERLLYGELAPSECGMRQMTSLVPAIKHSNPEGVLPIVVCSQIQCEGIVSVPCPTAQETKNS